MISLAVCGLSIDKVCERTARQIYLFMLFHSSWWQKNQQSILCHLFSFEFCFYLGWRIRSRGWVDGRRSIEKNRLMIYCLDCKIDGWFIRLTDVKIWVLRLSEGEFRVSKLFGIFLHSQIWSIAILPQQIIKIDPKPPNQSPLSSPIFEIIKRKEIYFLSQNYLRSMNER